MKIFVVFCALVVCIEGQARIPCGIDPKEPETRQKRIVGGQDIEANRWPWMAYIRVLRSKDNVQVDSCGATVIDDKWIITAAHCVYRYPLCNHTIHVYAGLTAAPTPNAEPAAEFSAIALSVKTHEYAFPRNDFALVEVAKEFDFANSSVRRICMGMPQLRKIEVVEATILGFGSVVQYNGTFCEQFDPPQLTTATNGLKELTVRLLTKEACIEAATAKLNQTFTPSLALRFRDALLGAAENMTCTRAQLVGGACHGDAGGPLMTRDAENGRWFLHGVIAKTLGGCGDPSSVDGFTLISPYCAAIEQLTNKNACNDKVGIAKVDARIEK